MWNFTPTDKEEAGSGLTAPFFEDARADFAPYYASDKSEGDAKTEVRAELAKLGGNRVMFQAGFFTIADQKRYGYNIRFHTRGAEAIIRVAGLPIRRETDRRVEQARIQALLNVRDWLKAAVTSQIFTPGSNPLTPFILVDGQRTVAEVMEIYVQSGQIPRLPAGPQADIEIEVE